MEDLNTALQEWITMGDQLVVCGDINENIMNHHITTFFANLGLRHLIFSKHDPTSAPATYYRNQQGESVDGVWASPLLTFSEADTWKKETSLATTAPYGLKSATPKPSADLYLPSGNLKNDVYNSATPNAYYATTPNFKDRGKVKS
jgi:hypothetical protein